MCGYSTESAPPAAIAPSTAEPPARSASTPAAEASECGEATMPLGANVAGLQVFMGNTALPLLRSQQRMLHDAVRHGLPVSQREDRLPPQPEIELHDHVTVVAGHPPGAG